MPTARLSRRKTAAGIAMMEPAGIPPMIPINTISGMADPNGRRSMAKPNNTNPKVIKVFGRRNFWAIQPPRGTDPIISQLLKLTRTAASLKAIPLEDKRGGPKLGNICTVIKSPDDGGKGDQINLTS